MNEQLKIIKYRIKKKEEKVKYNNENTVIFCQGSEVLLCVGKSNCPAKGTVIFTILLPITGK